MKESMSGTLYIVSTPIGNMEDISFRALRILKEVQCIAAEDTRRTQVLLNHYGISKRMESYHDYNKEIKTLKIIKYLLSGDSIAMVSDAGTPGISDPAYRLIQAAIKENINICPIPGPTALIAAISISGLPTDRFVFEGFLPVKKGRMRRIESIKSEHRTIILYESPHRLVRTLKDLHGSLGDRAVVICRELTKKFEEVIRTSLAKATDFFKNKKIKGEFVLVIQGVKDR